MSSQGVPQVGSLKNVTNKYCLCSSTFVSAFGFVGFILFFFSSGSENKGYQCQMGRGAASMESATGWGHSSAMTEEYYLYCRIHKLLHIYIYNYIYTVFKYIHYIVYILSQWFLDLPKTPEKKNKHIRIPTTDGFSNQKITVTSPKTRWLSIARSKDSAKDPLREHRGVPSSTVGFKANA